MNDNYYKDLWTKPDKEGTKFFYKVDFNSHEYRLQEHIFREFLKSLKRLQREEDSNIIPPIETVLEVGAGTGRMTKIVLEEFPNIIKYDCVELNFNEEKIRQTITSEYMRKTTWYNLDITSEEFELVFQQYDPLRTYDLILGSEIFMHIKPDDLGPVITKLVKLVAPDHGLIVNLDWYHNYPPEKSDWCFIHDYHKLYTTNGLTPIFTRDMIEIKQKLFCYGR